MPVEYSGIIEEHLAVRTRAGLFDVSHMGEIDIRGPAALSLLQYVTSNDVSKLAIGQAQYSALMCPEGSAVDDCVVHRLAQDHFFLCVNASNTDKDFEWITRHNTVSAEVRDASADYSQIALQGPAAPAILGRVTNIDLGALKYYWFSFGECCGVSGLLARTGYSGEDGFEFYFPPSESERVWNDLLEAGNREGLVPAGLGARNTLRLEAAFPLYGHELDDHTTLLEAGLGWITKLDKGEFLGRAVLNSQKQAGVSRRLVGLEMLDRGIAREGYAVLVDGQARGQVTSGSYAPFLKKNIAMAYLPPEDAEPGREVEVEIRHRPVPARLVRLPFYRRPKAT